MKKNVLSLLLVLALTICAVPFAAAEEFEPFFGFWAESNLLGMGYSDLETRTELAVGDTLEIRYLDAAPAAVYVNGEQVHQFSAGEDELYIYRISQTGTLDFAVRRGDETLVDRSFTVISSKEMYGKVVKETFAELSDMRVDPFPSAEELKDAANSGFPVGNPFLPFAFITMVITNLFHALFSFVRIVNV